MVWRADQGYVQVSLCEFVRAMLAHYPHPSRAVAADEWLWQEVNRPGATLLVRHSATPVTRDLPKFSDCAARYSPDGVDFLTTDDEGPVSLYDKVEDHPWSAESLLSLLQRSVLVTGTVKVRKSHPAPEQRKQEIRAQLTALCIRPRMASGSRLRQHALKLSHLASANGGIGREGLSFTSCAEEVRLRAYRTMSPLNMVPTPQPGRYHHQLLSAGKLGHFFLEQGDVGETPSILKALLAGLYLRFRELGRPEERALQASLLRTRLSAEICPRASDGALDVDGLLRYFDACAHTLLAIVPEIRTEDERVPASTSRPERATNMLAGALVERLSDDRYGPFDSDICGNDASNRENTQKLKEEKLASPFILRLRWRTSGAHPPRWVGCYRLDLRRLLEGGYMYRDPDGSPRLKIQHDGGEFYIRRRVRGPAVRLG